MAAATPHLLRYFENALGALGWLDARVVDVMHIEVGELFFFDEAALVAEALIC